jgi:hypothetical protein
MIQDHHKVILKHIYIYIYIHNQIKSKRGICVLLGLFLFFLIISFAHNEHNQNLNHKINKTNYWKLTKILPSTLQDSNHTKLHNFHNSLS